jgi:hypothetical protein
VTYSKGYRDIISHVIWLFHHFIWGFQYLERGLIRRGIDRPYNSLRKRLKSLVTSENQVVIDKLGRYSVTLIERDVAAIHGAEQCSNNRAESSHQGSRQQERPMCCFKMVRPAQGVVQSLFNFDCRLLNSRGHRELKCNALSCWRNSCQLEMSGA